MAFDVRRRVDGQRGHGPPVAPLAYHRDAGQLLQKSAKASLHGGLGPNQRNAMNGLWTVTRLPAGMDRQWTVALLPPTICPHTPWIAADAAIHSRLDNRSVLRTAPIGAAVFHTAHNPGDDGFIFLLSQKPEPQTRTPMPHPVRSQKLTLKGGGKTTKSNLSSGPFYTSVQINSATQVLGPNTGSVWPPRGGSDRAPLDSVH